MLRMTPPDHPGQLIRMEVIEPLGLSVTEAAKILGVARPALSSQKTGVRMQMNGNSSPVILLS